MFNDIVWAGSHTRLAPTAQIFDYIKGLEGKAMQPPFRSKKVRSCDLIIAEKCNLKCRKCYSWQKPTGGLSFDECKRIIDAVARVKDKECEINFGGGEPLLEPRICELISYAVRKGLKPALSTNGTLLSEDLAQALVASGLRRLSVSLDSLDATVHDTIAGVNGACEKTLQGLDTIKRYWKRGMLNIHTVLSAINIDSIRDLVTMVESDPRLSGINIQALAQPFHAEEDSDWFDCSEFQDLWPQDRARVDELLDWLYEKKQTSNKIINPAHQFRVYKLYYENPKRFSRKFRCNLGDYNITVNSQGVAHLCPFQEGLCDINENDLSSMWTSHLASKLRYKMYNCRTSCNNILNCYFEEENIDAFFSNQQTDLAQLSNENSVPRVEFCNLNVTPLCELDCAMCKIGTVGRGKKKHFKNNTLSLYEWRWIIRSLKEIASPDMRLYFSGGEPLTLKGIFHLVRFARNFGFFTLLGTSGSALNKTMCRKIIASDLNFLELSIDSNKPEVHDALRGRKGLYKKINNAVTWLKKHKPLLEVGISCVLSANNSADVLGFVDEVSEDERYSSMYFQALVQPYDTEPCDDWYINGEYSSLWPDYQVVEKCIDGLIERKKQGMKKIGNSVEQLFLYKEYYKNPKELKVIAQCARSARQLSINWLGYVSYCEAQGPVGSMRDFSLDELLSSTLGNVRRAELAECKRECNSVGCFTLKNGD